MISPENVATSSSSEPSVQDNTQCSTQEVDPRRLPQEEFNQQLSLLNHSVYYGLSETNNTNIDISHFYYGENLIGYNSRYSDSLFDF
ncbi:12965_t:CDS:2 [Entrophospora sp. SA101]|nr:14468_t:CDS:2 [Entrophospora sp. SA101]CAJ0853916.1 12965_t:CDS:2 [Entrophospora sp. SA101]